jgi:RNA polymerase sigma-70 factor (ECF subfamily)
LDEQAHYRWIASHILPLEVQARRWLSRHVRSLSQHDIDDLIQEAYSRIWTADPDTIARPRAYLFATLRNLILEQARHAQIVPMERMGEIDELRIPSDEPGPERRVAARQELERLKRLIVALPEQCRRVFELRKIEGHSQRDVAAKMGISERTVEKHLAKAVARMLHGIAGEEGREANEEVRKAGENGISTQQD